MTLSLLPRIPQINILRKKRATQNLVVELESEVEKT
jgi:hypothetical protein